MRMLGIVGAAAVLVAIAGAITWYVRYNRCHDRCTAALEQAERLAGGGDLGAAIALLDGVDASCDCMRFTEGDEPPEHAAMRVYVERLRARDGSAALDQVIERARGPMLRQLGKAE